MRDILINVSEKCLALIIPVAIVFIIITIIYFIKKKEKPLFKRLLLVFIFIYYVICTIRLTLFFEPSSQFSQNYTPFNFIYYGYREVLEQFIYNVLLFIPLGTFLPIVFKGKFDNWVKIILISLISSFLIETLQFFIGRNVDINDIIANTMGGITGYALYSIINYIHLIRKNSNTKNKSIILFYMVIALIVPLSVPVFCVT